MFKKDVFLFTIYSFKCRLSRPSANTFEMIYAEEALWLLKFVEMKKGVYVSIHGGY